MPKCKIGHWSRLRRNSNDLFKTIQRLRCTNNIIILSEKKFPKAKIIYVDFPDDLEKNRRCYTNADFVDTGEKLVEAGSPTLAMYKKELR